MNSRYMSERDLLQECEKITLQRIYVEFIFLPENVNKARGQYCELVGWSWVQLTPAVTKQGNMCGAWQWLG